MGNPKGKLKRKNVPMYLSVSDAQAEEDARKLVGNATPAHEVIQESIGQRKSPESAIETMRQHPAFKAQENKLRAAILKINPHIREKMAARLNDGLDATKDSGTPDQFARHAWFKTSAEVLGDLDPASPEGARVSIPLASLVELVNKSERARGMDATVIEGEVLESPTAKLDAEVIDGQADGPTVRPIVNPDAEA